MSQQQRWWCNLSCPTLSPSQINGHELKCNGGCNSGYWHNLNDGRLPYSGATNGSSGSLLYGDPTFNFWQQGWPGSPGNSGEPQFSILSNPAITSTEFDLLTEANYDAGIAALRFGIKLDFDTRAGVSVRSRVLPPADLGQSQRGDTEIRADAETAINLSAFLNVHINLFWPLSPIDLYFDYDIIDRKGNGHRSGKGSGGGYVWDDMREDGTNDAGTASCTAFETPQTTGPNPPSTTGWQFVEEASKASVTNLHPCNIKVCVPTDPQQPNGTFTYYDWNATTLGLDERKTNEACSVCDSSAAMCNASGTVVTPLKANKSANCGGTGDACGGAQVCDANDDCEGDLCIGGCCEPPPK